MTNVNLKAVPHAADEPLPAQRESRRWPRLAWLALLFAVQLLYVPINRTMAGGTLLKTRWDSLVPFWPVWALPYLLSIPWWVGCFIWAALRMEGWRFRALVAAVLAATLSAYLVYIAFPTYVERPVPAGTGWPLELVRLIHAYDRVNNAFPSGHTYTTLLIVFFWWEWQPRLRALWALIGAVVILSTLFTGQHHLLDPIGGAIWAWSGYRFGLWWSSRSERRRTLSSR